MSLARRRKAQPRDEERIVAPLDPEGARRAKIAAWTDPNAPPPNLAPIKRPDWWDAVANAPPDGMIAVADQLREKRDMKQGTTTITRVHGNATPTKGSERGFVDLGLLPRVGIFALGAVAVNRIDVLIPNWRPLGASIPPSLMAVPLALVAAYVVHRTAHPKIRDACLALGFGLTAGLLARAIQRKTGG